jgi:hypothetical protein
MIMLVAAVGCGERNPAELEQARAKIDPLVYGDDYYGEQSVYWQPFFETFYTAVQEDSVYAYGGFAFEESRSLKFQIAPQGSNLGLFTGGVLTAFEPRDLQDYNALTFYARASVDVTLDVAGFGNDNTGNSLYEAGRARIPLNRDWQFIVLPIPASSRLVSEAGLFTFAEGQDEVIASHPDGYDIWIDEIRFAKLSNIEHLRSNLRVVSQSIFLGSRVEIGGTQTIFRVDGAPVIMDHSANYFDFTSSEPSVAVAQGGVVRAVGTGSARITATLENPADPAAPYEVFGWVDLTVYDPPTAAAALPTFPAGDVVSLFSSAYVNSPVDAWRTDFQTAGYEEFTIAGRTTKMYTNLGYAVILFETRPVNASNLTHFHLDVYAPGGTDFVVKLAAEPLPGWTNTQPPQYGITLDGTTDPAFTSGDWVTLDIPLDSFEPDAISNTQPEDFDWTAVNQLIISSGPTSTTKLVLMDNILFRK